MLIAGPVRTTPCGMVGPRISSGTRNAGSYGIVLSASIRCSPSNQPLSEVKMTTVRRSAPVVRSVLIGSPDLAVQLDQGLRSLAGRLGHGSYGVMRQRRQLPQPGGLVRDVCLAMTPGPVIVESKRSRTADVTSGRPDRDARHPALPDRRVVCLVRAAEVRGKIRLVEEERPTRTPPIAESCAPRSPQGSSVVSAPEADQTPVATDGRVPVVVDTAPDGDRL